jgi:hypothetical protein
MKNTKKATRLALFLQKALLFVLSYDAVKQRRAAYKALFSSPTMMLCHSAVEPVK